MELKEDKIIKLIIKYSIPAILSMMIASLYNTIDRAFIGSIEDVGALAISGLGITMPIFTIIGAFCVSLAIGASTSMSIKLGENNKEEAQKILANVFIIEAIVGIFICILGNLYIDEILYFFGASENTISYARDYISVIFFGSWFNLPGFALNSAIRADNRPKLASNMLIFTCILNIILDPIFIFKYDMGIKGAALGTIICQFITFILSLYYFTLGNSNLKLKKENFKLDKKIMKMILAIAITPFLMELASGFIHLVINRQLKLYGSDLAIGAMATISSICLMFLMPVFGLSQAVQTIVAYNHGAKQHHRTRQTLKIANIISVVMLFVGFLLIRIYPNLFISIFTKDKEMIDIALNGLRIYSISLPIIGISIITTSYFQSINKIKLSIVLGLLRQVILLIPIILIVPRIYKLEGVWLSQPLADIGAMIIALIVVIRYNKKTTH